MIEPIDMWRAVPERLRPRSRRRRAPFRLHALRHPQAGEHAKRMFAPSIVVRVVFDRDSDRRLVGMRPIIRLVTNRE